MLENQSPFLDTLFLLRKEGSMAIYTDLQEISAKEEADAADYFASEFEKERLEFLSDQVSFHKKSAVWAAKVLYHSAQLYLVRKDTSGSLGKLIPDFTGERNVSSVLSADLSLRFLPQIIAVLHDADPDDPLVRPLENILVNFHYSGIGYDLNLGKINWQEELSNATYRKLYLERIVDKKDYRLAEIPYINHLLMAEFGLHKDEFWKELK